MNDLFPEIDVSMLDLGSNRAEPKIELRARRSSGVRQGSSPPSGAPDTGPAKVDWSVLRRQTPLARLLPATSRWADALPRDVVPHALLARYPRIANQLCRDWGQPDGHDYLYALLVDQRGGRRGFPQEVLDELLRLREHADSFEPAAVDRRVRRGS